MNSLKITHVISSSSVSVDWMMLPEYSEDVVEAEEMRLDL